MEKLSSNFYFFFRYKKNYIIIKDNMKGYSIVGAFKYIGFGFYYNDLLIYD